MTPNETKAREAAAKAIRDSLGLSWPDEKISESRWIEHADAAIDAYLSALSPLPDEQLDEIERKANEVLNPDPDFWGKLAHESLSRRSFAVTAAVPVLVAEVRRLRALSSHPDEDQRTGALDFIETTILEFAEAVEDEESIATPEDARGAAELILNGLPEFGFGARAHPDEETVTTVEELDALPVGSVVMEMTAEPFLGIPTVAGVFHKFPVAVQEPGRTPDEGWREWFVVAGHGARPATEIMLPARVLFRPTPEGSGS